MHGGAQRSEAVNGPSDDELIGRYRATQDAGCFAELFARYRKKIYLSCRRFYREGSAAEDATQETFLRAFQNLGHYGGGDFCGWLMRIARNVCIDQWRKRRPEVEIDDADFSESHAELTTLPAYELRSTIDRVWQEMRVLVPEQRRCLEM